MASPHGIALTDIEEGDAQGRLCPRASHPGEEDPEDETESYRDTSPFGPFGKRSLRRCAS